MIHMDVLQVTPILRGRFKDILVLIDNFSRYNWIYLLQKKHECKSKIMTFVKEIQSHLHITPAILHTDRGGEFGFSVFKSFLSQHGILLEQGPANSPQTNGLDKQLNQTILVKIRCMLAQSLVPLNYWDEAAQFASTLINIYAANILVGLEISIVGFRQHRFLDGTSPRCSHSSSFWPQGFCP
jgi:transposase InsO family protein